MSVQLARRPQLREGATRRVSRRPTTDEVVVVVVARLL